ncbi:hypothetical protein BS78_02G059500 [Paspalum vaginatum]|nr:hypothetical protein BS78_02G059500 [Paspalum vaginatum]
MCTWTFVHTLLKLICLPRLQIHPLTSSGEGLENSPWPRVTSSVMEVAVAPPPSVGRDSTREPSAADAL